MSPVWPLWRAPHCRSHLHSHVPTRVPLRWSIVVFSKKRFKNRLRANTATLERSNTTIAPPWLGLHFHQSIIFIPRRSCDGFVFCFYRTTGEITLAPRATSRQYVSYMMVAKFLLPSPPKYLWEKERRQGVRVGISTLQPQLEESHPPSQILHPRPEWLETCKTSSAPIFRYLIDQEVAIDL